MHAAAVQMGWRLGIVAGYVLFALYSIALTDLLRREIRRRNWLNAPSAFLRLAGSAAALAAVQTFLVFAVDLLLTGRSSTFLQHPSYAPGLWVSIAGADSLWLVFYVALTSGRRVREKEVHLQLALREAELRALEAQVNPHFLFNCLNSVRALVTENPAQAQDMITRLANILRYNLHRDLNHTVPLSAELEMAADYLALESARFEDRLRVRMDVDPAAAQVAVPPMLLQTLVENALKHGIAHLPAGGDLVIRAVLEGERLVLVVENTGQLIPAAPQTTQVGLKNTRERLRILYGGRASLELKNCDAGRVAATVLIPRTV
jgi:signal transduction histidine kinase